MIFVVSGVFSQKIAKISAKNSLTYKQEKQSSRAFSAFSQPVVPIKPLAPIQANYYAANLGFFCKQEIKFEKITKIPFRFRLGSVEQCDWMEGKRATVHH